MSGESELPAKAEPREKEAQVARDASHSFDSLRREMNRLFDDYAADFWVAPFWRSMLDAGSFWRRDHNSGKNPPVDLVEHENAFEITADLPGFDEKTTEVKITNGNLVIKGEKQAEKEEKKKDYYLHERRFDSFERSFRIPESVDTTKIEAVHKKGVLTITLPKKAEAQQADKKIEVKAA